jgi:hypothetical protein
VQQDRPRERRQIPVMTIPNTAAARLADSAAEAIRALNHATPPTGDDLTYPADVAATIGGMDACAARDSNPEPAD